MFIFLAGDCDLHLRTAAGAPPPPVLLDVARKKGNMSIVQGIYIESIDRSMMMMMGQVITLHTTLKVYCSC